MKPPAAASSDPGDEIAALVIQLQETQARLQVLTGGGVDAILAPGGRPYLLQEAQEKLRQSETSQRQLADTLTTTLNALPAHIALLDGEGVFIAVNDAWRNYGAENSLQGQEVGVKQNYVEICERARGEGSREAHASARGIRQVLSGEAKSFTMEYHCHSPAERRWYQLVVTPVEAEGRSGAVVMHIDITARKRNEEQLVWKTALLEAQLNSTLDGVLLVDKERRTILQNQRLMDLWKVPAHLVNEIEPHDRFDWVSSQVKNPREFVEKVHWLYDHPDEVALEEIELLDGRCLDRYSAPIRDEQGKHYGRIWVFRDITERKLAEKRVAEQIDLITMAGRVGKLGAWAAEFPGPKLIWSEEIYRIHEVDHNFQPGHESTLSFFTPESRRKLEAAIATQRPYDLELEIITAQGNKRWVRTTSAVERKDGELKRLYGIFQDITERKRIETRFRRLIDSNAQSVFFWNVRGEITDANDAFLNLAGYSREDLEAGRINWMKLTPPEYAEQDRRAVEEVKAHGAGPTYEKEFVRKDGLRVPILIGAATFEDNPEEGICFVVDLTAQKRVESRFRRLVDSNAQGVMFWKSSGEILHGNDAFLRLLGYTREELADGRLNWMDLTPPEYAAADRRALNEIAATGVCNPVEKEWIRKDGSRVPVYLSAASFEDSPNEGVTFILDLAERKRAEARLRRLIDSNVQSVIFWHANGEVLYANDGFLRLVGYTREDLDAGRINWKQITPPEYAAADEKALAEIAEKGICATYEKEYIRKDGSRVPVLIGAACFEDNPDEGVRFILDLTERKKLEQQFLRAQRMESIGTLAGGIAHDLNNILAPIMMSIGILKLSTTDPQARSILETIEMTSKRGADIVRQVLSFARGVEGERIEVQPRHLLKDIESIIRDTFPKNIHQELLIAEDTWTILGDPTQLHQILLNLCVNARDAMPHGGKLIISIENCILDQQYASMHVEAKPGKYVVIGVTDTGTGIPAELLEKIFEPFFTTKEVGRGTGLGLSTVMGIVKSHEGVVNVYSEPGRGTTFKVYLPAVEGTPEDRKKQTQQIFLPRGNGETILVVDDEASILTITSQTLEAFGYRAITAADGAEAVAIYARDPAKIAVVITDMMMPLMDGSSTIRALLRINPSARIIAASGLNATGTALRTPESGVRHFLAKPYTAGALLKALRTILDESPAAG